MAVRDLEAFVRERAAIFDPNLDLTPGAPFDRQVIQPLIRRVGIDPFTVDMETFITSRLNQAYPTLSVDEGDAMVDLLVKPVQLLWDPIVREIDRVRKGLSFRDPNTLTVDEAEALGANLFAERPQGEFARGVGRIFFSQAQNATVTPVNLVTAKNGRIFFPEESQSIRVEEMLLNDNGDGTFYFDVNLVAEAPGDAYNISPGELSSIANLEAAVRVTNLRKFQRGVDEATAAEFVDAAKQQLTERSLVTLRGIAAQITTAFPEVNRLNVVGFNDPEMNRDIIKGGGLGPIVAAGTLGVSLVDTVGTTFSTLFRADDVGVNFLSSIGPIGPSEGVVLTIFGAFGINAVARDLDVTQVLSADTIELSPAALIPGLSDLPWTLRRRTLTLSDIPGGILFPDGPTGTVTIPDGIIHIGGATDVHVRGTGFDEASLLVDDLTDDQPELSGLLGTFDGVNDTLVILEDLTLEVGEYTAGSAIFNLLERAARDSLTLQIVDGPNAAAYRILEVLQVSGSSPAVVVTPALVTAVADTARWRIFDAINVDLVDIRETRIAGDDLSTLQGSDVVTSTTVDFDAVGVAKGDVLRITSGSSKGDYQVIVDPIAPGFESLQVDRPLAVSEANLTFEVFRANDAGSLVLPLVRISSVELLDSSSQPVGTTIPYARPVDVQSRAFQNPARGVKHRFSDGRIGMVGIPEPVGGYLVGGEDLLLQYKKDGIPVTVTVSFTPVPPNKTLVEVIDAINDAVSTASSGVFTDVAIVTNGNRLGIRPFGDNGFVTTLGYTAPVALFGVSGGLQYTTHDIRSTAVEGLGGWGKLEPPFDLLTGVDVLQVLTGNQVGLVPGPYVLGGSLAAAALRVAAGDHPFAPEAGVTLVVGSRSIGSVRLFFLEPTSFEVRSGETVFTLQTENGPLSFIPDPSLSYQRIPALPGGDKPHDGQATEGTGLFTVLSGDFVQSGIRAGDLLELDFQPLAGTVILPDPVPGLVNKKLKFSIDGGPTRTLIFIRDDVSLGPTEVSRQSVADQINAAAGIDMATITPSNTLEFEAEVEIRIRSTAAGSDANPLILGNVATTAAPVYTFDDVDQDNISPYRLPSGKYTIENVNGPVSLTISPTPEKSVGKEGYPNFSTRQQYRVFRAGVQRISTAEMANNEAEAGLFYFDVELFSEGIGDVFNIDADLQLTVAGYRSDGYYLTTDDSNLTFSPVEHPRMVISKTILEQGADDDPTNATQLGGQNIQINYERSGLVNDVNSFITAETERVVCNSPLGRHLIPNFIRFDVDYTGGSSEDVVLPDLENYVRNLAPVEAAESSDIQNLIGGRGATSIENPIELIGIVHDVDRTIRAIRSQNRLTAGRLSAFIPDRITPTRTVG